jgi:hypothetical protein
MANQNFLPLVSGTRVLGVVPITQANFSSSSTTAVVNGNTVNVEWRSKDIDGSSPVSFAVLPITASQLRTGYYKQLFPTLIDITQLVLRNRWFSVTALTTNDLLPTQNGVMHFLATGVDTGSITSTTQSPPTASNGTFVWNITTNFIGTSACTFTDVNWLELLATSYPGLEPVSVSLSDPTPNSILTNIRAYIVQTPGVFGAGGVVYNTLRFVKIRADDPTPGTYTYNATITAKNGLTTTVVISLIVQ